MPDAAVPGSDTAPWRPPPAAPVIMFVGTSLTAGLGVEPDQAYPALIQQKIDSAGLHYRVVNAGVSGETSAGARAPHRLAVARAGRRPGARDRCQRRAAGTGPDSIRGNIQAIIDRVHAAQPATRILLVGMNAMPNLGRAYSRPIRGDLSRRSPAPTACPSSRPCSKGVGGVDSLNQPDGIHPTPAGHRRLAANVWQTLLPLLTPSS